MGVSSHPSSIHLKSLLQSCRSSTLGIQLLICNFLRLRLLLAKERTDPTQRIGADDQSRRHNRLAIRHNPLPTNLLLLTTKYTHNIFLPLRSLLQWEKHNSLSVIV
jgi:hypothetical protein